MNLKYSMLPGRFAVCRLPADSPVPTIPNPSLLFSVTRTADELSVVCLQEDAPDEAKVEAGWVCFKLHGPFAFDQTGILAGFVGPLADYGIPIFAVSTFDTDYVFIKPEFAGMANDALRAAGHELT